MHYINLRLTYLLTSCMVQIKYRDMYHVKGNFSIISRSLSLMGTTLKSSADLIQDYFHIIASHLGSQQFFSSWSQMH